MKFRVFLLSASSTGLGHKLVGRIRFFIFVVSFLTLVNFPIFFSRLKRFEIWRSTNALSTHSSDGAIELFYVKGNERRFH